MQPKTSWRAGRLALGALIVASSCRDFQSPALNGAMAGTPASPETSAGAPPDGGRASIGPTTSGTGGIGRSSGGTGSRGGISAGGTSPAAAGSTGGAVHEEPDPDSGAAGQSSGGTGEDAGGYSGNPSSAGVGGQAGGGAGATGAAGQATGGSDQAGGGYSGNPSSAGVGGQAAGGTGDGAGGYSGNPSAAGVGGLGLAGDSTGGAGDGTGPTPSPIFPGYGAMDYYGVFALDISAVSRGLGMIDFFAISLTGEVVLHPYDISWRPGERLEGPPGVTFRAVAAANDGLRLDVIAAGSNQKLYYTRSLVEDLGQPTFAGWEEIPGALAASYPDSLSLLRREGGMLDAFWVTPQGNVGHAWGIDDLEATESGDDTQVPYLRPAVPAHTLNGVTTTSDRIDLVLDGASDRPLQHLWYDGAAGGWGDPDNPHRTLLTCRKLDPEPEPFSLRPSSFAVVRSWDGQFELFVVDRVGDFVSLYQTAHQIDAGWHRGDGAVWFERVSTSYGAFTTNALVDALVWNGHRMELFGVTTSTGSVLQLFTYF
jgi:hypothetical protein